MTETLTKTKQSTTIEFEVDKNIIYSLIKSQAGSPSKAFLELVMNSIDANSTEVEITFDNRTFRVKDNGKGFQSEEEIHKFFKTFGTPHEEGDAIYGRFRMGRGQIMAFSKNTWRTNTFCMEVDVLHNGTEFEFSNDLDYIDGVDISGEFYETLTNYEYNSIINELRDFLKYSQIKTIVNGVVINKDLTETRWTIENDISYIQVKENEHYHDTLSVYNLGVLVCKYPANKFGFSGTIVSKKQLEVNFARNDILITQCKVWKSIIKTMRNHFSDKIERKIQSRKKLTDTELHNLSNEIFNGEFSWNEISKFPIFIDILGKPFTFQKLLKETVITISKDNKVIDERLYKKEIAFVLDSKTLTNFNVETTKEFSDKIRDLVFDEGNHLDKQKFKNIEFKEIEELQPLINENFEELEDKELTEKQLASLKSIRKFQHLILGVINIADTNLTNTINKRNIKIGKSEIANGWTDGFSNIYIEKNQLRKSDLGIMGWMHIATLIVHEYLHVNGETELHDVNFYENFHNVMRTEPIQRRQYSQDLDNGILRFIKKANEMYIQELTKIEKNISRRNLDLKSITAKNS